MPLPCTLLKTCLAPLPCLRIRVALFELTSQSPGNIAYTLGFASREPYCLIDRIELFPCVPPLVQVISILQPDIHDATKLMGVDLRRRCWLIEQSQIDMEMLLEGIC